MKLKDLKVTSFVTSDMKWIKGGCSDCCEEPTIYKNCSKNTCGDGCGDASMHDIDVVND